MTKLAFTTGITGQDGSYLAEFLLAKGYEVHGLKRRSSSFNTDRIDHIYQDRHIVGRRLHLQYSDLSDTSNLTGLITKIQPDEIYNLGAMSHVAVSFESPEYTANVDALWHHTNIRGYPTARPGEQNALLSSFNLGAIRPSTRNATDRNHPFLPTLTLRRCQTLRALDYRKLS